MTTNMKGNRLVRGAAILAAMMMMVFLGAVSNALALPCDVKVIVVDDAGILSSTNELQVFARTPSYDFGTGCPDSGTYWIQRNDSVTYAGFAFFNTFYLPYPQNWTKFYPFPAYPGYSEQSFIFEDHNTPKHQYKATVQLAWDANHCPIIHIVIINYA